jgi:hypothetical protein
MRSTKSMILAHKINTDRIIANRIKRTRESMHIFFLLFSTGTKKKQEQIENHVECICVFSSAPKLIFDGNVQEEC